MGEVFDRMDFEPEHEDEDLEHKLMGEWAYEQFDRIPREREKMCIRDSTWSSPPPTPASAGS